MAKFITDNIKDYEVWPSGWRFSSRDYLYYEIFDNILYEHYKKSGSNINLVCRPFLTQWAKEYFLNNIYPAIPVTVNIRNNPAYQHHRNANLDAWLELFRYCQSKYSVKFIVICAQSEIDERFRELDNVICSKDNFAGIDQELALIQNSALHMGVGSGPMSMAWFGKRPYLMVNTKYPKGYFAHDDMLVPINYNVSRFCFGSDFQRISSERETAVFLIEQFSELIKEINLDEWVDQNKEVVAHQLNLPTWLR